LKRLNATSDTNEVDTQIDESIIDYLSKKIVVDQTEQLALARISGKVQTSIEQAEKSLERLRAKDWIRKYKLPGKISFELTPMGKAALEANAKARKDRITRQLQQAISQQQKAKLRTNILNKMASLGDKWKGYPVPDKDKMASLELEAAKFLAETKDTQAKQPHCQLNPQGYDQEFSFYKTQIENFTNQNYNIYKALNNYTQIKPDLLAVSDDIEKICKTIAKNESEPEVYAQVDKLRTLLNILKPIQNQLGTFENDRLARMEELKVKLAENSKTLDALKKPTHEFALTKKLSTADKTLLYPDPELPMIHDRQTIRRPLEERCVKCGAIRKSAPFSIG
jgi:hypothetical protein